MYILAYFGASAIASVLAALLENYLFSFVIGSFCASYFGYCWMDDNARRSKLYYGRGMEFVVIVFPIIGMSWYFIRRYRWCFFLSLIGYCLIIGLSEVLSSMIYSLITGKNSA